jgi:YggT family protein
MMGVLGFVSLLLLLVQVLLIARAALDWSVALAGPTAAGSVRGRLTAGVHAITEPILAPVRRVLPRCASAAWPSTWRSLSCSWPSS